MNGSSLGDMPRDHRRMDDQPGHDVEIQVQDRVDGQECLGQRQPSDGAVIQGALQPLGRRGLGGGRRQRHHEPGQRADALGAHRVALVGHRRGADLLGLERLLQLALVGQQPQVRAEPVGALADARQRGEHLGVDLARVGLARDGDTSPRSRTPRPPSCRAPRPWRRRRRRAPGSWPACRSSP